MPFISDDFMLKNETAKRLYHGCAEKLPIIDFHCHLSPKMMAEDYRFSDACQLFLGGDHYKWRQMRSCGVPEAYITGSADPYEKWLAFAKVMPYFIGNPLYHWTHLELARYFDIDLCLNKDTARTIWDRVNDCLLRPEFSVRGLIRKSKVAVICTTDDPYDDLSYHKALRGFDAKVLPTFRPKLSEIPRDITARMDYFHDNGCRLSDHAVDDFSDETVEKLIFLGEEYARRGWVMQLHIGALRNNNSKMLEHLGADTGFDSVNDFAVAKPLSRLLDTLEQKDLLPKTVLYTLNPKDNYVLGTMLGNFQRAPHFGKIQFGSAWWFNDHRDGMESQLSSLANLGTLGTFVGMLTDSRSFVSFTRHEYFRRILCNLMGKWVEEGEYPNDEGMLSELVQRICYQNAKEYFGF